MKFLILSAFPEEQNFYFKYFKNTRQQKIGFVCAATAHFNGHQIILASTGMGTINAAATIAYLDAQENFDALFFSGTSGGVAPDLNIGDVIVATKTYDADLFGIHEAIIDTPFESALINPNNQTKTPKFFNADEKLLQDCLSHNKIKNLRRGLIGTTNHFPSPAFAYEMIKQLNTEVIDMESNSIYQYAWLHQKPALVVRSVSNLLDSTGNDKNVAESDVSSSDNAAKVVLNTLQAQSSA